MIVCNKGEPFGTLAFNTCLELVRIHLLHNHCDMEVSIHGMNHNELNEVIIHNLSVFAGIVHTSPVIQASPFEGSLTRGTRHPIPISAQLCIIVITGLGRLATPFHPEVKHLV